MWCTKHETSPSLKAPFICFRNANTKTKREKHPPSSIISILHEQVNIFAHRAMNVTILIHSAPFTFFPPKWNEKKEKSVNTRQERQQWNNNEKGKTRFSFFFLRFTLSRDENKKHKGKHTGGGFESQQAVVKNAEGKRLPFALFIIHEDSSSSAIKTTKREGKRGRGKPFTMKLQLVD